MKNENKNVIGERMKELRGLISQHQAAAGVGIKAANWNVYENGKSLPGAKVIIKLCQYYGVSADWLLGLDNVRKVSCEVSPIRLPVHPPKTLQPKGDTVLLAEIATLKRRIDALEQSQVRPAFACG